MVKKVKFCEKDGTYICYFLQIKISLATYIFWIVKVVVLKSTHISKERHWL